MNPALSHIQETLVHLRSQVQKEIIGQDDLIEKLLITLFAGGHALLEWVPGLGKTKAIRTLAHALGLPTKRISFTPDLLPSDLTGAEIYRPGKGEFEIRKGPIYTNILLADEINRTPPKVQSALLEAMEEKHVTIAHETFPLPSPFVVFATQNPLEHEGTYPLPEAQLDRFLMRIILTYPKPIDELDILKKETLTQQITADTPSAPYTPPSVSDIEEMISYITEHVRVDQQIFAYISELLGAYRALTRPGNDGFAPLTYGPSTRAGLALIKTARVHALFRERDYVLPEDIKALAHSVFDHRIGLSYDAMSEGIHQSDITERILDTVAISGIG